jgi:hypothetical protein
MKFPELRAKKELINVYQPKQKGRYNNALTVPPLIIAHSFLQKLKNQYNYN